MAGIGSNLVWLAAGRLEAPDKADDDVVAEASSYELFEHRLVVR